MKGPKERVKRFSFHIQPSALFRGYKGEGALKGYGEDMIHPGLGDYLCHGRGSLASLESIWAGPGRGEKPLVRKTLLILGQVLAEVRASTGLWLVTGGILTLSPLYSEHINNM